MDSPRTLGSPSTASPDSTQLSGRFSHLKRFTGVSESVDTSLNILQSLTIDDLSSTRHSFVIPVAKPLYEAPSVSTVNDFNDTQNRYEAVGDHGEEEEEEQRGDDLELQEAEMTMEDELVIDSLPLVMDRIRELKDVIFKKAGSVEGSVDVSTQLRTLRKPGTCVACKWFNNGLDAVALFTQRNPVGTQLLEDDLLRKRCECRKGVHGIPVRKCLGCTLFNQAVSDAVALLKNSNWNPGVGKSFVACALEDSWKGSITKRVQDVVKAAQASYGPDIEEFEQLARMVRERLEQNLLMQIDMNGGEVRYGFSVLPRVLYDSRVVYDPNGRAEAR